MNEAGDGPKPVDVVLWAALMLLALASAGAL